MKRAFTLIELLIVVAIIAILAAIAVPNFLEAQTRSKISHEYSNMRTNRVALESYRVDFDEYVPDTGNEDQSWAFLTTPIAFLSSIPRAVFPEWRVIGGTGSRLPGSAGAEPHFWYLYWGGGLTTDAGPILRKAAYLITCAGPDQVRGRIVGTTISDSIGGGDLWAINGTEIRYRDPSEALIRKLYDPTNGTVSGGDVAASYLGMHNN